MIIYKTQQEIEIMRESALLVSKTLAELAKNIRPGVSTAQLDKLAEEFIKDHGAEPGFKGYHGYKYTLCTSVNEQVVHGLPDDRPLQEGDILSVDCGVLKNGFYGDSAYTFPIGEISEDIKSLLKVTLDSLLAAIEQVKIGARIGDVSFAVQEHAEKNGFSVVRELVGHGVGRKLHEKPEVPNYGKKGAGHVMKEGLVIAIEPMINMGKKNVIQEKDGWTIRTADRLPSAHFEHTVALTKTGADVLSTFEYIEEAIKQVVN